MMNTKNTSVNSKTAPAIYKYLANEHLLECSKVFDYGCGRYYEVTMNYCFEQGAQMYTPYDLYWEIGGIPIYAKHDLIVCANVLNVIKSYKEREIVLWTMKDSLLEGGIIAIQIYEGNRHNVGEETTKGYQMNCKTSWYLQEILKVFYEQNWEFKKYRNFIIIKNLLPWE